MIKKKKRRVEKSILHKLQFIRRQVVFFFNKIMIITVNNYYSRRDIPQFTCYELVCGDWFSQPSLIHTHFSITHFCQILLRAKKYSRQPHDNLSHAITCWFTVSLYLVENRFPNLKLSILKCICLQVHENKRYKHCAR